MFKKIVLLLIILIQPMLGYPAGTTGASFLKIAPGARPVGMGGAYIAISGDINSLYYNPAGIGNITKLQIGAMHTEWVSDIRYDFAAGAFNMRDGVLGVSLTLLTMGEMEGRGANREQTDDFGAYDFAFAVSYAKDMSYSGSDKSDPYKCRGLIHQAQLGGSLKIIGQKIERETATGIAIDMGIQKKITDNINLGIVVRNFGPGIKFIKEKYNLPLTLGTGAGLTIGGVTLSLDTNYEINDKNIKLSFGTEYLPVKFLSLRGGYLIKFKMQKSKIKMNQNEIKMQNEELNHDGLGGGIGINVLNYSLDYAVVPYSELGTTQRISFIVKF